MDEFKDSVLEAQYQNWLKTVDVSKFESLSDNDVRSAIIQDLQNVSAMGVEEYTLYQKWCEIQDFYPTHEVSTLFGSEKQYINPQDELLIKKIKDNLWYPKNNDDYLELEPILVYTKDEELSETWNCIRTFTSTMKNNSNIGRNLNYLVIDNITKKYLGVICISSDFLDLTPRDEYIGWLREKKTQGKMINYTAIGSTIVPIQPLGYNAVGGKLLALLCLSDEVQNQWKKQYGDVLVGVTTTSLYGKSKTNGLSQYDRLTHWKKMGMTAGSISYETTRPTVELLRSWLKKNYTREWFQWYMAKKESGQPYKRDHKNRSYNFVYTKLNIPKELIKTDHARGIYFSPLYDNTKEFLRGEIDETKLVKSFDTSYNALVGLWKTKYMTKRLENLKQSNRLSNEVLFYDDLAFLSWDECKDKYLKNVGR